jgi:cell division protease FtsH
MFCNDISSGAREDIRSGTSLARSMVREWGMSPSIGPVFYGDEETQFGFDAITTKQYSEATSVEIDKEVRIIIDQCFERSRQLLQANRAAVHAVAEQLLEKEVLDGADVEKIVRQFTEIPAKGGASPPQTTPDAGRGTAESGVSPAPSS